MRPPVIRALCFDQGGTLLYRVPLPDRGRADFEAMLRLAGVSGDPGEWGRRWSDRDKEYKRWSLETRQEATEEVIWGKWMLPEAPKDRIEEHCSELTLLFSHSKGERVFREDALPTLKALHHRGFKLGLVTNTVSRLLVPEELSRAGLTPYFDAVIMSSITGSRKPEPEMFLEVCRRLGVSADATAYVGDAPDRDVIGPRRAGYGMTVLLSPSGEPRKEDLPPDHRPDKMVGTLHELLTLFPPGNDPEEY